MYVAIGEILVQVARCTVKIGCPVSDDGVAYLAQTRLPGLRGIERGDFLAVIQQCHGPEKVQEYFALLAEGMNQR